VASGGPICQISASFYFANIPKIFFCFSRKVLLNNSPQEKEQRKKLWDATPRRRLPTRRASASDNDAAEFPQHAGHDSDATRSARLAAGGATVMEGW
jgi:hypothetical protein